MVKIDKVYTRGGDMGVTSLGNGNRVSKDSLRVQVCGALDEVNAAIGVARLHVDGTADVMLARIQNDLFDLGADLCVPEDLKRSQVMRIRKQQVSRLEKEIDKVNTRLSSLNSFVLPGGSKGAAFAHLARTVVRRAERLATSLNRVEPISDHCLPYLNRLSDHLFVLARSLNDDGQNDVLWLPGENQ
jgi:cob(I)alamin adenosyltransferase